MKKSPILNTLLWLVFGISIFVVYIPIIVIILMSFTETTSLSQIGLSSTTFKWYASIFSSNYSALEIGSKYRTNIDNLKIAITNTFSITILATIISTILGTMFAIGIHSFNKKIRTSLMVLNNIPIVNPDIVTGFLLLLIFVLFETLFGLHRGFVTVLISHIFFSIPYVILNVLPRLNQIDQNTYEAARDLGCTRFGAVFKAIIPSISTGIISGAIFAFTMSIDDFVITMFTSGQEYSNVSTWLDSVMRRGYIPKTVFSYNVIVFVIALIVIMLPRLISNKNKKEGF